MTKVDLVGLCLERYEELRQKMENGIEVLSVCDVEFICIILTVRVSEN